MSGEFTMAVIGLATIGANAWIAWYQTRASRNKNNAEAAGSITAAASGLVEDLRKELDRKQADCDKRITDLSADLFAMHAQLSAMQVQLDAQAATLKRKDAALAIAAHQLDAAGIAPLWKEGE